MPYIATITYAHMHVSQMHMNMYMYVQSIALSCVSTALQCAVFVDDITGYCDDGTER